ncbi:MAG: hypothetical protein WD077_03030 [Bacteroidia bacterium]
MKYLPYVLLAVSLFLIPSASASSLDSLVACYQRNPQPCDVLLRKVISSEGFATQYAAVDYLNVAEQLMQSGQLRPALQLLHKTEASFNEPELRTQARIIGGISGIYLYLGKLDSSLLYANQNVTLFTREKDTTKKGMALLNRGQIYKELGDYPAAMADYLQAIRYFKATGNSNMIARTQAELATLSAMNGEMQVALEYNRLAAAYFREVADSSNYGYVILNLANDLNFLEKPDSALLLLREAVNIFNSLGKAYLLMNAEAQMGRSLFLLGQQKEALNRFRSSNNIGRSGDYLAQLAYNHTYISKIYMELRVLDSALHHAQMALRHTKEIGFNEEYGHALLQLSKVYEARGEYQQGLAFRKQFHEVQDSLFNLEKARQVQQIKETYESELKEERLKSQEAAISLLEARSRTQWIRNIALAAGLLLTIVIAFLVINRQQTKIKLNRELAQKKEQLHRFQLKEKEATEKQLRLELDHKKRELTSQALLIAEKNELLRSFKDKLREISRDGNGKGQQEMNRLVQRIERAEIKSDDWDKFMRIFEEVHPDFLQSLQATYAELTPNDLRLVALMRMNLSNKEIANILHISDDGLKKARYRLRKRLALASEENMNEFLMHEV